METEIIKILQNPIVSIGILSLVVYSLVKSFLNNKKNDRVGIEVRELSKQLNNDFRHELDNLWSEFRDFRSSINIKIEKIDERIRFLEKKI